MAETVRGRLRQPKGKEPALETADGGTVRLEGDEATQAVLKDKRLAGAEVAFEGHFKEPGLFAIDPIHKRALFLYKDGRRLMITYYCDVCAIRFYRPGICWCCQEETRLDLIESDQP